MIALEEAQQTYVSQFEALENKLSGSAPDWLLRIRKEAIGRFTELGFPTTRHEEWRYTNVTPLTQTSYAAAEPGADVARSQLAPFLFEGVPASVLVFVDGHFSPALSAVGDLPAGVRVGPLAAGLRDDAARVQAHLTRYATFKDNAFCALNTACFSDGAWIHVPRGQVVELPIHVVYVNSAAGTHVSHPRALVVADVDSQMTLVESYVGLGEGRCFTNAVTEVVAGENANVDHYRIQREPTEALHVAELQYHQHRSSTVILHSVALGGAVVRNNINTYLDGDGGHCALKGLTMLSGTQHVDNHLWVEHAKPHCDSREYFKGIYDEQSRGVFSGRIRVHEGAQKTDAKQTNMSLLLSENALADSKPQLEIFADDVKCTHGATIGQIDEEAIFYLRSRGMAREAARSLMVYAFAREVLDEVQIEPLRRQLGHLMLARLPQGQALEEGL